MQNKNIKKLAIISLSTIVIAASILGVLEATKTINLFGKKNTVSKAAGTDQKVNLDPPTSEDKKQVDTNKERIVEQDKTISEQPQPSIGKQTTTPSISYAGQYNGQVEIGAVVPVFEDGGTCTATITLGKSTVTKTVTAVQNARSVDCPVMRASRSEFSTAGTWSASVTYNSAAYQGTSAAKSIVVE